MKTLHKPQVYYGWIIVAIGFFTMMLIMGSFFSSGVLFAAIVGETGWSRATVSLPFSIALIVYAATAWLAGRLFDRYGPRRLFPLGALCLGLGLIVTAQVHTPWQLCLSWGLLVAQGFNLAGIAPHLAHVALWFTRYRGMASGLVLSGASVGGLVLVPGAQYLVDHYGWRPAYTILGAVVMLCLIPLNAVGQLHRPADLGLHSDGVAVPPIAATTQGRPAQDAPWMLWHAMGTGPFWLIFVLGVCLGWLSNITGVHQIAHIINNGHPSMAAASIVGIVSLLRAVSSAIGGGLSDRLGREVVFSVGSLLCTLGLLCLVLLQPSSPSWLLYGYALAFGLGYGVYGAVYAAATADLFFGPSLGTILGALELGWGLGGFAGAWFGGFWHDQWGSYHGAFVLSMGANLLGWLALWLAAPRRLRRDEPQHP
ncbi:MAG TPA: MFS transporter [Alphaproteobacteria bacterium]|nr:MFS transporter [Alphaproteobacteria bacterium]